jgi:putative hemolysin
LESESLPPGAFYNTFFYSLSILKLDLSLDLLFIFFLLAFLLFLSAVISGSEVSYFSFGPADEDMMKASGESKDESILRILERKKLLLSTILISNNFVNVSIIILSSYIITKLFDFTGFLWLDILFNIVFVTSLLVFFGEVMPKILASKRNYKFARFTLPYIQSFIFIFYPFALVMSKFGNFLDNKVERKKDAINLNEIEKAIDLGVDDNTQERDKRLLKGIVHFGNTTVKQIMKPRVDVFAINENEAFNQVIELIKESGYSRIPIFRDTLDNVVGVLYIKDLLEFLNEKPNFNWQTLVRPASFTSEGKKIDDLLREIQVSKQHLYIVADEYGGTLGILTLEDILEEVVGEINDEYDDEEDAEVQKNNDGTYIFDGKTSLLDMCKLVGIESGTFEDDKGGSDTLAGLILENLGRMPIEGDTINIYHFEFTILEVEKNRIRKIFMKINDDEQ